MATKESVWTVPKELQDIKDKIAAETKVGTWRLAPGTINLCHLAPDT